MKPVNSKSKLLFNKTFEESEISYQVCSAKSCKKPAKYPIPYFFENKLAYKHVCFDHAKEYNKNWNYYKDQPYSVFEDDIIAKQNGARPTVPFKNAINFSKAFEEKYKIFSNKTKNQTNSAEPLKKTIIEDNIKAEIFVASSINEKKALAKLGFFNQVKISSLISAYKKFVKKLHPDKFQASCDKIKLDNEKQLKEINSAYMVIKKALKK